MAKTRAQKVQNVEDIANKLQRMKSAVLVDYKGTKVKDAQKIREASWTEGIDYEVVKKTLLRLALKSAGLEGKTEDKALQGNIAIMFGYKDEVETAKFAARFAKELESFRILGGLVESRFIDDNAIKTLAALPGRVELLARVAGTIKAPISGFVNVLSGNLGGLVRVLSAIKDSKLSG